MLVSRLVSAMVFGLCSFAVLAEEEAPDIEFLEYLGMWEESDEDWLMFSGSATAEDRRQERSEPAPSSPRPATKSWNGPRRWARIPGSITGASLSGSGACWNRPAVPVSTCYMTTGTSAPG